MLCPETLAEPVPHEGRIGDIPHAGVNRSTRSCCLAGLIPAAAGHSSAQERKKGFETLRPQRTPRLPPRLAPSAFPSSAVSVPPRSRHADTQFHALWNLSRPDRAVGDLGRPSQGVRSAPYFLAGEELPWYAIGGSIIAANISTEHFIGMVGIAYAVGFVVAQWEWGNVVTFSALIWIFLPFYIRGGLYTMPEFLERRYNAHCRHLFAVCCLVLWIVAQMAVVMLAGAKAMRGMFDIDETSTIVVLALLSGSYTIYGGLKSVAWTDFLQFIVMMIGGLVVTVVGLAKVGGLGALMYANPEKFKIIYPATDPEYPWFGVWTLFLSVGIWYNCTNQFIVQRCLAPAASGMPGWAWCSPAS